MCCFAILCDLLLLLLQPRQRDGLQAGAAVRLAAPTSDYCCCRRRAHTAAAAAAAALVLPFLSATTTNRQVQIALLISYCHQLASADCPLDQLLPPTGKHEVPSCQAVAIQR